MNYTHPGVPLEQQSREQGPANVSQRSASLRNSGPRCPLARLHEVDNDDGRHGEHSCSTDALHDAGAYQLSGGLAGGGHDSTDDVEGDARQVGVLAAGGVGNIGEDELEDGLCQEVAGGNGEYDNLAGLEVVCDVLCRLMELVSMLFHQDKG